MSGKKARKYEEETELRKGPWTLEEDTLLIHYIACHGEGRWNLLARCSGLKRTGKSCRLRWLNYLKPDVKRGNLTPEEQFLILELHSKWGNRWSRIAQHLPGRTDNEIKNYWRTRVQKQAKQLKIDANSELFRDAVRRFWMPRLMEKIGPSPPQASVVQSMDNPTFVHPLPRQPPNHPMIPPAEPTLPPTTRCSTATALNDVSGRYQLLQFEDDCSPSISVDAMAAGSSRLLAPAPPDRHHQIINATGNDKYTTTYDPFLFAGGDFTNLAYGFDGLDFHQERMAPPLGAVGSSSASDCSMMMEVEDGMDGRGRGGNHNNNTMMADSLFSILMNCDMQSEKLHEWD